MFNLKITANTADELRLKLLDMVDHLKDINVKKSEPEPVKPVISAAQMEENIKNAPVHELPKPPAIEEVRAALKELRDRKGPDAVREILKAYGAGTLSELKEEDYLGALARAKTEV
jgi:hypothetical protein